MRCWVSGVRSSVLGVSYPQWRGFNFLVSNHRSTVNCVQGGVAQGQSRGLISPLSEVQVLPPPPTMHRPLPPSDAHPLFGSSPGSPRHFVRDGAYIIRPASALEEEKAIISLGTPGLLRPLLRPFCPCLSRIARLCGTRREPSGSLIAAFDPFLAPNLLLGPLSTDGPRQGPITEEGT